MAAPRQRRHVLDLQDHLLDLQDLVRVHGGTARQAWVALEGPFLGNAEYRALQLDVTFRTFVQGTSPLVSTAGG